MDKNNFKFEIEGIEWEMVDGKLDVDGIEWEDDPLQPEMYVIARAYYEITVDFWKRLEATRKQTDDVMMEMKQMLEKMEKISNEDEKEV